ncbi:MAG: DHH family phosphoesterase, partial [Oscillospiraceae bacterium]|nr:DHH family phosphoesterase [Oscillospiraceae bacterium]
MNKKLSTMFQPSMRLYFIILIIFAALSFVFTTSKWLAYVEIAIIILLFFYTRLLSKKRNQELIKYIESVTNNMDTATMDTLKGSPLPVLIFSPRDDLIVWSNSRFYDISGDREHLFESRVSEVVPGFTGKWLIEGKSECPELIQLGGR